VPAQDLRAAASDLAPFAEPGIPIVIGAKGIEQSSGMRLSEVLVEAIPTADAAVLSGPSFASDVAKGLPTAVTIAARSAEAALELCRALSGPTFRPYAETDIIGVELGGALKNVLAIAAGIVAGRGLGASASAALVARGFEMRRYAESAARAARR
jgi:glycerol-3-phosphate dehydrogenase (NAD(P)+)